jgi:hypothetical protein
MTAIAAKGGRTIDLQRRGGLLGFAGTGTWKGLAVGRFRSRNCPNAPASKSVAPKRMRPPRSRPEVARGQHSMSSTITVQALVSPKSASAPDVVSAMPFLRRDAKSVWTRAADLRDQMYDTLAATCHELNIVALVNKSIDFVYPAWVSLEAWLPASGPEATYRMFASFQITPKPHSRYEFEVKVQWERDGKKKSKGPFMQMGDAAVAEWARFLLEKGPKPKTRKYRVRVFPWQLWYPKNKVTGLGYNMPNVISIALVAIGMVLIQSVPLAGVIFIMLGVIGLYLSGRRRKITVNAGRPIAEPRTLRLADSWSTMANQLGQEWQGFRDRLFKVLAEGQSWNIQARVENISHITPDGKQERQQLVLSQGRGIVFCHIYPYGDDLYVGWDAYLNYGQWAERAIASGYEAKLQSPVVINTVTPGVARATEYDLIDVSSLTEWVHSRVVQVLKQIMAEHKLDQEIDFKIVRGERQSLLRDQEKQRRRPLFSRANPTAETPKD